MKKLAALAIVVAVMAGCQKTGPQPADAAPAPAGAPAPEGAAQPAATAPVKPVPAQLPDVLATIDDDKVERWELEGAMKGIEARAGAPIPTDRRDEILRNLLDQIVAYHVLAREAKDRKVSVTDAEVAAQLEKIKGGFPNQQAFQEALSSQGITLVQLERQTRIGLDIDKILEAEVTPQLQVADAEIGEFYQKNLAQFEQGESVHASHILFMTPQGAEGGQKEAAKTKAQQVLKQVKAGGDFAALAKEHSQDPGSAPAGGDLGFFPKGQTDPAFEAAAFALKPGDVSEVVESQFGYHVIKVHEHRPARTATLDEVSGQIREYLIGQQRDTKIQTFIEQAKAKRKVQILI